MKGTLDGGGSARGYHYKPVCWERSRIRKNREQELRGRWRAKDSPATVLGGCLHLYDNDLSCQTAVLPSECATAC